MDEQLGELMYVAGPLSDPDPTRQQAKVAQAMAVSRELIKKGWVVFCPPVSHFFHEWAKQFGGEPSYEYYMRLDLTILSDAKAMFFIGSSPGADREHALAERWGIPIYTRIEDVPDGQVTRTFARVDGVVAL